jgi:Ni,Fe-hydrogenase I small subunit
MSDTFYDVMRRQGITRRSFLKFCSLTAAAMGLAPEFAGKIAHAMETKPRIPVLWLHGLECTCCSAYGRNSHAESRADREIPYAEISLAITSGVVLERDTRKRRHRRCSRTLEGFAP